MRKVIFNMAISLDGYIADNEGGFQWIKGHGNSSMDSNEKYDFNAFLETIDTIVMGSKAYLDCPIETIESFKEKKLLVFSSKELSHDDNVRLCKGNVVAELESCKSSPGKDIWIFGGAGLVEPLLKSDFIDEYIIGIIPVILGDGINLFNGRHQPIELLLYQTYVDDGIVILKYKKR